MNSAPSSDRLFSLSCFEGLRLFRYYAAKHQTTETEELLDLINSVEADAPSLDMEAGVQLHPLVAQDSPLDGPVFYQNCIKTVIVNRQPIWAKSMLQGRVRFVDSLDRDERDVFAAAGLLESPPAPAVVQWWDDIVGNARLEIDIEKMKQGRAAEAMTIQKEKSRLMYLGIAKTPQWTGLDDNYAGYDVLSFDLIDGAVVNRMIEVKSTRNYPLRFHLTRNEWQTADKIGRAYFFHIWDMFSDPPVLFERTVSDIRPHIPSDNEAGKWSNAVIPL